MFIAYASTCLIASIYICHTHFHNLSTPSCYLCTDIKNYPLSVTNEFYGTSIALLGWFLSQYASLQWPHPCIELLRCISKHNKLVQLVIQIQYHVNVIYNLGVSTHTYQHHRCNVMNETLFTKPTNVFDHVTILIIAHTYIHYIIVYILQWTKAISRNQVHTGHRLVCAWFKTVEGIK